MAVFLGISRTIEFLTYKPGDWNFWCIEKSQHPKRDDLLLLYFPVSVSRIANGIRQIYRITSQPRITNDSECVSRSMAHVDTELLLNLAEGIKFNDLKKHPRVREWGAIRRNMQGVTFTINSTIWLALRTMIEEADPRARAFLQSETIEDTYTGS